MINLLRERRSVRAYTGQPIEEAKLVILQEAVLRSPTSKNRNSWRFLFITEPALLAQMSVAKPHGAAFMRDAALGVVVCGNRDESDVWIEDCCSIASIILQLTAQSLDLGSCWIQIRERMHDHSTTAEVYLQDLLNLSGNLSVEAIISIGYPQKPPEGKSYDDLPFEKILDLSAKK